MQWLLILSGYILGSMLFGYRITRSIRHVDIREVSEDKNPGTYNAFVYGGFWCGILTLICDLLKGSIPVFLFRKYQGMQSMLFSLAMAAPVFGHAFSVFHRKKGGKGIAVSFGVLLALMPVWQPVVLLAFFYIFFSVVLPIESHRKRSIATFACFCIGCLFCTAERSVRAGCILISAIVIYKHHLVEEKVHESVDLIM